MLTQRDTVWRGPAAKHELEQARASQSVMLQPSSQWNPTPVQVVTSQSVTQQLEPQKYPAAHVVTAHRSTEQRGPVNTPVTQSRQSQSSTLQPLPHWMAMPPVPSGAPV